MATLITNPKDDGKGTNPIRFACVIKIDDEYLTDVLDVSYDINEALLIDGKNEAKRFYRQIKKYEKDRKVELIKLSNEQLQEIIEYRKNKEANNG